MDRNLTTHIDAGYYEGFSLPTLKEMLNYVQSFRDQKDCKGHPAQLVVDILASTDAGVSERHSQLLENWYAEYAKSRGMQYLYKNSSVESCLMINGWFFFPTSVKYVVLKGVLVFFFESYFTQEMNLGMNDETSKMPITCLRQGGFTKQHV